MFATYNDNVHLLAFVVVLGKVVICIFVNGKNQLKNELSKHRQNTISSCTLCNYIVHCSCSDFVFDHISADKTYRARRRVLLPSVLYIEKTQRTRP